MARTLTSVWTVGQSTAYSQGTGVTLLGTEDVTTITPGGTLSSITFTSGTGSNQVNVRYQATRTVAATTNDDLDLSGSLTDVFGNSIVMTAMKSLHIYNQSATYTFNVGAAGTNPISTLFANTSDILVIPPSGGFSIFAPLAGFGITGGSADALRVRNTGAASADYIIVVEGVM